MTPEAQLALIASLVPVIGAIGAVIAYVVNSKLNHITVLTNSTLTAANKRIEVLEEMVRALVADREKPAATPDQQAVVDKIVADVKP